MESMGGMAMNQKTKMCAYCCRQYPIEEILELETSNMTNHYCLDHYDQVKEFVDEQRRKAEEYHRQNPGSRAFFESVFYKNGKKEK